MFFLVLLFRSVISILGLIKVPFGDFLDVFVFYFLGISSKVFFWGGGFSNQSKVGTGSKSGPP